MLSAAVPPLDSRRSLDGAMGSELIARYAARPEDLLVAWNDTRPEAVSAVHRAYLAAGAQLLTTNTLLAPLCEAEIGERLLRAGIALAREAGRGLVATALSLGPGAPDPSRYGALARVGQDAGVSFVQLETFTQTREAEAAIQAIREAAPNLPVALLLVFDSYGRVLGDGVPAVEAASRVLAAGADLVGVNCIPPAALETVVTALHKALPPKLPLLVRPSAGIPSSGAEGIRYPWAPEPWAAFAGRLHAVARERPMFVGGCCGAGPEHITALSRTLKGNAALRDHAEPALPLP